MKIKKLFFATFASVFAGFCGASEYDLAAYVWPAYQPEPRWKELGIFEPGNGKTFTRLLPKNRGTGSRKYLSGDTKTRLTQ